MSLKTAIASRYVISEFEEKNLTFQSVQLDQLYHMIKSGYGTMAWYRSPEADNEWEEAQKEGYKDRREWLIEQDDFNFDHGNPAHSFWGMDRVTDAWLIHFTDANPNKIVQEGFKGRDPMFLGLTKMWKEGSNEGDLAFAYPANDVKEFFRYGKRAVVLRAKEAMLANHSGDDERQAIFDVNMVEEMYPVDGEGKELILYDDDGEEVHRCGDRRGCVMDIVQFLLERKGDSGS